MAPLPTYQPFKALYVLYSLVLETIRFPLWLLTYLSSSGRPHKQWTFRQALGVRVVKAVLYHISTVQIKTHLSLNPGREGHRFIVMPPAPSSQYTGLLTDASIHPLPTGATWTPTAPTAAEKSTANVVLHLHGGAYVVGDGRDHDTGFGASILLAHARFTHVLTPQYRLSSQAHNAGRFPAALQDALTAYLHLIDTLSIPASRITISGDSAGGNLVLALLRYIACHGAALRIPPPAAALLWSPWVDPATSQDEARIYRNPNYGTDYVNGVFGAWGASAYTGFGAVDPRDPYVTPLGRPFRTETPLWIQTGACEVLFADNGVLAKELEGAGNEVGFWVTEGAPHDVLLAGKILGFQKEAAEAGRKAGEFVRRVRGD